MKKLNLSKKQKLIIYALVLFFLVGFNLVYAETKAELKFCEYSGVLRALKIVGILIIIAKIVVPLLIIITASITFGKTVMSGKVDDLKGDFMLLVKKIIAGLLIFIIPDLLDFTFNELVEYDDSSFENCTVCIFDPDGCQIPTTDPNIYTD